MREREDIFSEEINRLGSYNRVQVRVSVRELPLLVSRGIRGQVKDLIFSLVLESPQALFVSPANHLLSKCFQRVVVPNCIIYDEQW